MNIADYIASGILELYVHGNSSPQESKEVECMSHIYPEIKAELQSLQFALESLATSQSKTPPAFLKNKILNSLNELRVEESKSAIINLNTNTIRTNNLVESAPIININRKKVASINFQLKAAAAILLTCCIGMAIFSYYSNNNAKKEIANAKIDLLKQKDIVLLHKKQIDIISNLNFKPIQMKGIESKSPLSAATIYWNKNSNEVFVSVAQLPKPSTGKQYQLWAIKNGKPIDMGMLNVANFKQAFQKMKTIDNAQAFAITLETVGGVPSPTMTEMYVMGGV